GDARVTDLAARYGGDEFMVLMPETRVEEALGAVERMRKRIAERPVSDGKRTLPISVSAGISAAEADRTATSDTLIHLADEAMYAAKYAGGNATRTWKQITRDQAEEVSEEAARVEDPRRHLARGKR
ncbi:MAG TPA: GGDEF domain-containing protein, partial [Phycisphaerae bacterium]|nr:GGDEF domain-containing protein [Phycisphaerae bacterium]